MMAPETSEPDPAQGPAESWLLAHIDPRGEALFARLARLKRASTASRWLLLALPLGLALPIGATLFSAAGGAQRPLPEWELTLALAYMPLFALPVLLLLASLLIIRRDLRRDPPDPALSPALSRQAAVAAALYRLRWPLVIGWLLHCLSAAETLLLAFWVGPAADPTPVDPALFAAITASIIGSMLGMLGLNLAASGVGGLIAARQTQGGLQELASPWALVLFVPLACVSITALPWIGLLITDATWWWLDLPFFVALLLLPLWALRQMLQLPAEER